VPGFGASFAAVGAALPTGAAAGAVVVVVVVTGALPSGVVAALTLTGRIAKPAANRPEEASIRKRFIEVSFPPGGRWLLPAEKE